MIIQKGTKHPQTRHDMPNENWLQTHEVEGWEDWEVYDDASELGQKILKHAPFYDEVRDQDGKLIDIIPTERPQDPPPILEQSQEENAFLFLELTKATDRAQSAEQANADLTLELVAKGVL